MRRLALIFALTLALPLQAQKRVVIDSKPTCANCTIEITRMMTAVPSDSLAVPSPRPFVVDGAGRLYLFDSRRGVVMQYGSDGKLLKQIGRQGRGPGEFQYVRGMAVGVGDTIYLADDAMSRLTILSPSGAVARIVTVGARYSSLIPSASGEIFAAGPLGTADGECYGVLAADGARKAKWGTCKPGDAYMLEGMMFAWMRHVAVANGGRLWSARYNRYEIEAYDKTGSPTVTVVRQADWFEPWEPDPKKMRPFTERPLPLVTGLATLADGNLLVAVTKAADDWTAPPLNSKGQLPPSSTWESKVVTTFEVLDPQNGKLLASHTIKGRIFPLSDAYYADTREGEDGERVVDVFRVILKRK
jgi:hypothetical protein